MSIVFPAEKGRFLVTGPFDEDMPDYYIMICDYKWWAEHEKEIYNWMWQCLPKGQDHHSGMVVTLQREADVTNFLLKWS